MYVRLILSIGFFFSVLGNQTTSVEHHRGDLFRRNQPGRNQPSEIKELCRILHNFALPRSNSIVNVTCIKRESEIIQYFMNLFNSQLATAEQFALIHNKSLDYFRRDGVLAICVLSCNRGQPSSLDSDRAEPIAINFGCDDISRFACRESTCPSSIYDVDNGVVTCTQGVNVNSVCHVVCDTGYLPRSPITKTCSDSNQLWEPSSPFVCAAACGIADLIVKNGDVVCSDGSFDQSVCTLHCHDGFKPAGAVTIRCHRSIWYPPTIFKCKKADENQREINILCNTAPENREQCGNNQITSEICLQHSCCWDNSPDVSFPCYRSTDKNSTATDSRYQLPNYNASLPIQIQLHGLHEEFDVVRRPNPTPFEKDIIGLFPLHTCGCNNIDRGFFIGECFRAPISDSSLTPSPGSRMHGLSLPISSNGPILKIYNGSNSEAVTWPWHAVVYFSTQLCGGSLIHSNLVITAGHCVTGRDGSVIQRGTVVLGVHDFSVLQESSRSRDPNLQFFMSGGVVRHPNFTENPETGATTNDIALIRLHHHANLSGPYVNTICYPYTDIRVEDECYVTGFGLTSGNSVRANILQQVCLPIVNITDCQNDYGASILPSQHICAGLNTPGSPGTCRGDSGGPLVCKRRNSAGGSDIHHCGWFLAGITSFGNSPCVGGSPSVFVNVYNFRHWIFQMANTHFK